MKNTYQMMPDLSPEDYAELKADIDKRGVQVAIEYDEKGNVLDGHHRLKICNELGITDWPKVVRVGMTETQKREHARKLNMARRQLNREQRQELIRQQLRDTPEKSDRHIASTLGVDHKTVGSIRNNLESVGEIPQQETVITSDGKERPRQVQRQEPPFPTTEEILNTPLTSLIPKEEPVLKSVPLPIAEPPEEISNNIFPTSWNERNIDTKICELLGTTPNDLKKAEFIRNSCSPKIVQAVENGKLTLDEALETLNNSTEDNIINTQRQELKPAFIQKIKPAPDPEDKEIDRQHYISMQIQKMIFVPAGYESSNIDEAVRIYLEWTPGESADDSIERLHRGIKTLQDLVSAFERTKKLKVVK
ncbi:hypothetical protein Ga0466249_002877 [Sporomusaceae bacterium BoRhaA]|uniref:ParB N-terminal domain-containing protein n=1 Tax=Pelorhabdus rhamnosifermentans TaxID=2772457 RepID=UPI001C063A6C|nr:ParB N-terminal domain-containing protein [Pelorhabdus rhamnosifermentans]MBU2701758.1 hypothetical protein [Pelorhabdus rhamnosifermentans]